MLNFDHIAITVNDLLESIKFYAKLGYELQEQFNDNEYKWATLKLGETRLEIFEPLTKETPKIEHIAYSFNEDEEVFAVINQLGYSKEKLEIFYGNLNRKSFFIKDNSGISIQFIKNKNNK